MQYPPYLLIVESHTLPEIESESEMCPEIPPYAGQGPLLQSRAASATEYTIEYGAEKRILTLFWYRGNFERPIGKANVYCQLIPKNYKMFLS